VIDSCHGLGLGRGSWVTKCDPLSALPYSTADYGVTLTIALGTLTGHDTNSPVERPSSGTQADEWHAMASGMA